VVVDVPHFAFPFSLAGGRVTVVEQDTDDEIIACVEAILAHPLGSRPEVPNFGVELGEFQQGGPALGEVRSALAAWEPRADVHLELTDALLTDSIARVRIGYDATEGGT
jgi:phage baseplate assembly protein W